MRSYRLTFTTSANLNSPWSHGYVEDDYQAEILARGVLNAADPSIISVEVWEGGRLVCQIQRDTGS